MGKVSQLSVCGVRTAATFHGVWRGAWHRTRSTNGNFSFSALDRKSTHPGAARLARKEREEGTLSNLGWGICGRDSAGAPSLAKCCPSLTLLPTPQPQTEHASHKSAGGTQECDGLGEHPRNDNIHAQERGRSDPTPTHAGLWALPSWASAPGAQRPSPSLSGRLEPS